MMRQSERTNAKIKSLKTIALNCEKGQKVRNKRKDPKGQHLIFLLEGPVFKGSRLKVSQKHKSI